VRILSVIRGEKFMDEIYKEQFDEWCFDFAVDLYKLIRDEISAHGIKEDVTTATDSKIDHFEHRVKSKLFEVLEQEVVPSESVD